MKKMSLLALLVGAALFTGLGATSALADSKCGAGKCGGEVKKPQQSRCGAQQDGKCGDGRAMKPGKCGSEKSTKCGDGKMMTPGKCGSEERAPMQGKCGR
ncbi:MAG: hypothetical protein ABFR02_04425 [Campylobacterota bacterium]